jgi:hypothetical protein
MHMENRNPGPAEFGQVLRDAGCKPFKAHVTVRTPQRPSKDDIEARVEAALKSHPKKNRYTVLAEVRYQANQEAADRPLIERDSTFSAYLLPLGVRIEGINVIFPDDDGDHALPANSAEGLPSLDYLGNLGEEDD